MTPFKVKLLVCLEFYLEKNEKAQHLTFLENWIYFHLHDHGGAGDGLNVGDEGDRLLLPR